MGSGPLPPYLDYSEATLRSSTFLHDTAFDFPDLFDIADTTDTIKPKIGNVVSKSQIELLVRDFASPLKEQILAEFLHSATLENNFVLSDTVTGELKKDLTYLKTLDHTSVTQTQLDSLYEDPDGLITPDLANALFLGGEPIAGDKETMIGMRLPRASISDVESSGQDFSILPVITEFQLSAGVAADDQTSPGELYLIHKLYLELWNPYTLPFVLGKPDLATNLGYSDLKIEITNLPEFIITNDTSGENVSSSLPDLEYLLSRDSGDKIMRPGMVFYTTLPRDSAGDADSGAFHTPLGVSLAGSNSDGYTGQFTMSGPILIRILGINSAGDEREIYEFELDGYPDFEIDYAADQRATWFNRRRTSEDGQFGMNNESLERLGYAFGFRFKMLDIQTSETMLTDLSNWLSIRDPRQRRLSIDLNSWDINSAWIDPDTPPYDFRLSNNDFDPGFFDPSESFKDDDFFFYYTGNEGGRRDRIARVFNLATTEPTNLDLLNGLFYPGNRPNPVGNPWGEELNSVYDRYFFSTLPDPSAPDTEITTKPLLNSRLKVLDESLSLTDIDAAEGLILQNGFNLNSTSPLAWAKILSGHHFAAGQIEMQYEQGNFPNEPEWFRTTGAATNVFFKFPEAAAFNTTERESNPRYEFLLRGDTSNYENAFRIDSIDWQANRQHPSFVQCIRELQDDAALELGRAITSELYQYYEDNGHPPISMADYISSGILQNAINATPGINQRANGFDEIPSFGPSNVDQRTLLNAIGNFASVRSDTFEITARADVTDPVTGGISATAMCRAIVQRMPEEHENSTFGRKLQILQFEWLTNFD